MIRAEDLGLGGLNGMGGGGVGTSPAALVGGLLALGDVNPLTISIGILSSTHDGLHWRFEVIAFMIDHYLGALVARIQSLSLCLRGVFHLLPEVILGLCVPELRVVGDSLGVDDFVADVGDVVETISKKGI